jgi:hypothetical protein
MKCEFPLLTEVERFDIFENAEPSTNSTSRGILIDLREQLQNASDSICFNRESCSNEIDESDLHDEKHDEQRISTERGIVIDLREESRNAYDSICFNRELFSNAIDESDLCDEKHDEQRLSIVRGIMIDSNGQSGNALEPIRLNEIVAASEGTKADERRKT